MNLKTNNKSTQDWLIIENIDKNGIIKIKNKNTYIKILKIQPINFNLKTSLEKEAILNSYKIFLKTCNFDIQILIQSKKENLNSHIKKVEENSNKKENNFLKEISENYINYIKNLNKSKKSSSKEFYLIISNEKEEAKKSLKTKEMIKTELKEKYFKIKENLARCGNSTFEITEKKDILKLYNTFFNTRINNNRE